MHYELEQLGIDETTTTEAVNEAVKNTDRTTMVNVNSVCGSAAGGVRLPGASIARRRARPYAGAASGTASARHRTRRRARHGDIAAVVATDDSLALEVKHEHG